jgi:hypothetical protein
MNQYIITKPMINEILNLLQGEKYREVHAVLSKCRPYQSERVGTDGLTDMEYAYQKAVEDIEILHDRLQKGRDKVLELCVNERKKLTFDSSFATDNAYNEGRLSIIKIIEEELRKAGE